MANGRRIVASSALVLLAAAVAGAQPIGTAFTYQGRLTDAGEPADGVYDLQLALFDAAAGGAAVGPLLTRDDVVVTNGLFTVPLDFGAVFAGSKRWLELRVRPGASTGAYTALGARQELTPSPNASFAAGVPWAGIAGKPAGFADDVDDDSGGDITGVAAGTGLTGGGAAGAVTLHVDLAGSGTAPTVARSDHAHLGQTWTGPGLGLRVQSTTAGASALMGTNTATTDQGSGVRGEVRSPVGVAVVGTNLATTGQGYGMYGSATSPDGISVRGSAFAETGAPIGVMGDVSALSGFGVYGVSGNRAGNGAGVFGLASAPGGHGGVFRNGAGGTALWVDGSAAIGTSVASPGTLLDVAGIVRSGAGGFRFPDGTTQTTAAQAGANDHTHSGQTWTLPVIAEPVLRVVNSMTDGVGFGDGLWGETRTLLSGRGVVGYASGTGGSGIGVWGQGDGPAGRGVYALATAPSGATYGLYAEAASAAGWAGWFQGRAHVTGLLSKGGGSFKIDHPLDPENRYLYHSFVESPDMKNMYDGVVTTDGEGFATVELPEWFEALNRDFRYQLTVIGQFAQAIVAREVEHNLFTIRTSVPAVKVSWQVTGIRHDAFAEKNRIAVEEEKEPDARGTYLHPDAFGLPAERGLAARRSPLSPPSPE